MLIEPTPLQAWAKAHEPSEDLIYRAGFWSQIKLIRDQVPCELSCFKATRDTTLENLKAIRQRLMVIATHRSKSIELPVFEITIPAPVASPLLEPVLPLARFTLRDNMHNWKVSVDAADPVVIPGIQHLCTNGLRKPINSVYCEGFPGDRVFGPYVADKRKFTVEIPNDNLLFTFFWLFAHQGTEPLDETPRDEG